MKYPVCVALIVLFWGSRVASAEQMCFRTSDCAEDERCSPVAGSAMGLCRALHNEAAERRSRDTENFNPWVQGGGVSNSDDGGSDE